MIQYPYDLIYEYDTNGQLSTLTQINRKNKKSKLERTISV